MILFISLYSIKGFLKEMNSILSNFISIMFSCLTPSASKYDLYISNNKTDLPHRLIPVITLTFPSQALFISLSKYQSLLIISFYSLNYLHSR